MNIIISTPSASLQAALAKKLIPKGINPIRMNTLDEIYAAVPVRGRICFIEDTEFENQQLLDVIKNLKNDIEKKGSLIIVLTKSADMDLVKVYVQAGAALVLQSSLHQETIVEKAYSFIQGSSQQHNQRKFIRIKPEKSDDAILKFLMQSTNAYIEGKVTDISMGGVAANFPKDDVDVMKVREVYPNAQILVAKRNILANIRLIRVGGNLAAFSYEKMRATFQDSLAEYIFEKTQITPS